MQEKCVRCGTYHILSRTVDLLGMIVCSVVLCWGIAEAAHVSRVSAGSVGSPAQGASGSPVPAQPSASSWPGPYRGRSASEAAGGERPRSEQPQRVSLNGPGSGRRRGTGRRCRRHGQRRGGSAHAGRPAQSEKRVMRCLKQHVEMTSHAPRTRRIARPWARMSRSWSADEQAADANVRSGSDPAAFH